MALDADDGGGGRRAGRRRDGGGSAASASASASAARRPMATHRDLISVDPEDDLLSVVRALQRHGIHHLPVLDADQARRLARGRVRARAR